VAEPAAAWQVRLKVSDPVALQWEAETGRRSRDRSPWPTCCARSGFHSADLVRMALRSKSVPASMCAKPPRFDTTIAAAPGPPATNRSNQVKQAAAAAPSPAGHDFHAHHHPLPRAPKTHGPWGPSASAKAARIPESARRTSIAPLLLWLEAAARKALVYLEPRNSIRLKLPQAAMTGTVPTSPAEPRLARFFSRRKPSGNAPSRPWL